MAKAQEGGFRFGGSGSSNPLVCFCLFLAAVAFSGALTLPRTTAVVAAVTGLVVGTRTLAGTGTFAFAFAFAIAFLAVTASLGALAVRRALALTIWLGHLVASWIETWGGETLKK